MRKKRKNKNQTPISKIKRRIKLVMEIKDKKRGFVALFPKISAIVFILTLFAFLSKDIMRLLANVPLLFNYFFGVIILVVLIAFWNRTKMAGLSFIILGLLYWALTWDRILAVSTISTAFWLILTGLLFIVAESEVMETKKFVKKRIK